MCFTKKIFSDFILNFIASTICIGTMQLAVYPVISRRCDTEYYGLVLMLIGLVNIIGGTFGNSLNNLRLITNKEYSDDNIVGDFNFLLLVSLIISIFCCSLLAVYFKLTVLQWIYLIILGLFSIFRNYISVEFILTINYRKVMIMNILMSFGYIIGILSYMYMCDNFKLWFIAFFMSELFAAVYLVKETSLLREGLKKTLHFGVTLRKYCNLIYTSLVAGLLVYFDRNLLYPLLGGTAVSTYFAATVVGKAAGLVTGPMSNVLLSYYAQNDFEMTRKRFWQINKAICGAGFITYIITILVVDIVVKNLYPQLYNEASKIFYLASIVPILEVISSMASPAVVKYVPLDRLSFFQTIFFILTCFISYYAISWYGLVGFCYGAIILSTIKIICMWILGHFAIIS